jgi:hypothetical protein
MDGTFSRQWLDMKYVHSVSQKKRDNLGDLGVVGNVITGCLAQQFRTWRCERRNSHGRAKPCSAGPPLRPATETASRLGRKKNDDMISSYASLPGPMQIGYCDLQPINCDVFEPSICYRGRSAECNTVWTNAERRAFMRLGLYLYTWLCNNCSTISSTVQSTQLDYALLFRMWVKFTFSL